jgi:hypothetical protein
MIDMFCEGLHVSGRWLAAQLADRQGAVQVKYLLLYLFTAAGSMYILYFCSPRWLPVLADRSLTSNRQNAVQTGVVMVLCYFIIVCFTLVGMYWGLAAILADRQDAVQVGGVMLLCYFVMARVTSVGMFWGAGWLHHSLTQLAW